MSNPMTDSNMWMALAQFGGLVLVGLGLKGQVDTLAKSVIYKDTCKVCGNSLAKELEQLREAISRQHEEQMDLIKRVYQGQPKGEGD